jgi:tight adherence protein C
MNMLSLIVVTLIIVAGCGFGFVLLSALGGLDPTRKRVLKNLYSGTELADPGKKRKADAAAEKENKQAVSRAAQFLPGKSRWLLSMLLARAGRPEKWPLERVINAKLVLSAGGLVLGLAIFARKPSLPTFALAVALIAIISILPELRLYSLGLERKQRITLELADTLDQMSIAVDAGLGFDAALMRVAKNGDGVLAQEINRTLQDVQIGMERRVAYEALIDRGQAEDLKLFMRAIIQADKHGLSLASVLKTQAEEMRLKRKQRAEKKAMQIPVKITFPLMLFVLPVLMIVVMTPAVINIINAFSH